MSAAQIADITAMRAMGTIDDDGVVAAFCECLADSFDSLLLRSGIDETGIQQRVFQR